MAKRQLSDHAERVNFLLSQIMRHLFSAPAKKIKMPEVTTGQLRLLRLLKHSDNCTMKELARLAGITMPTATGIVDRMVEGGLVVRVDDPDDRRVVRVKLTRRARGLIEKWRQLRGERIDSILTRLSKTDRARFVEAFETIHAVLDRKDEHGK